MNVLLVDDETAILDILVEVLEGAGFHVTLASSAEDALTMTAPPDVLVTDLNLGAGMSGFQLATEARRRWPRLPVVFMSGRPWLMNDRAMDEREAFLPKPFQVRALLGGIRRVTAKVSRVTARVN